MSEPTRGKVVSARTRGGRALATVLLANGDTRTRVELLMPYGMSAVPEAGADVVIMEMGGNRDHLVALMADQTDLRVPDLAPGEAALRDKRGQQVVLRSDGVEISGALKITIVSAGVVELTAPSVIINGTLTVTGDVVAAGISLVNHTHTETDGTTSPPNP